MSTSIGTEALVLSAFIIISSLTNGGETALLGVDASVDPLRELVVGITYEDNHERVDYISMHHFHAHS